ncbi:hypothetical protein [Chishuiella changwenlii]|uniref:hypothetical protein n=1 Tax=Chishuiella changwenlii TaxID=1434701 RepID=UPI002FD93DCC
MNYLLKSIYFFLLLVIFSCSKIKVQQNKNDLDFKKEINKSKNIILINELHKHNIKPSKLFILEEVQYPDTYTYVYDQFSNKRFFIEGKVYNNEINSKNIDLLKDKDYFLFDYYEEIIKYLEQNNIKKLKEEKNLYYSDDSYTHFEILDFKNKNYLIDSVKYFGDNFENREFKSNN